MAGPAHLWDPEHYLAFADERGRPFLDLLARIDAAAPSAVVDLGCGAGNSTLLLKRRWPDAEVVGVDSSAEMIERGDPSSGVRFERGDLREWQPPGPVGVVVSNAALQWVPGHLDLLPRLLTHVAGGGWLALQVPGNFDQPSHTIRQELARDSRFAPYLENVPTPRAFGPATYLERLLALGCRVDAWETTYLHLLTGQDPVFAWASGTSALPTLQALPPQVRAQFADELRRGLRRAYPPGRHGTVLPFRRVFVVARKP